MSLAATDVTERSVIATLGLIALLTIIISGTFAGGGGIGSNTDPKIYQLNLHMYAIAGFLALIAWLLAIINTLRIHAWGWFATSLLLFGIGALMFGLFGPTAEDVARAAYRRRRGARRVCAEVSRSVSTWLLIVSVTPLAGPLDRSGASAASSCLPYLCASS